MGWSDDVKTVDLNLEVVVQACILIPGLAQTEEEFKDTLGYKLKPSLRKKRKSKQNSRMYEFQGNRKLREY